jgi:hypothetical protein
MFFLRRPPVFAELPFPLIPALMAACSDEIFAKDTGLAWQPDWPVDIPPDAFSVKGASLIRLSGTSSTGVEEAAETETAAETAALVPFEYRLSRDDQGRLVEFPFSQGGRFWQIRVDYTPLGGIAALVFSAVGEDEATVAEFPRPYVPFESPAPKLPDEAVRLSQGETVYFVLFEEGVRHIAESWYDPAGNLAGYFNSVFEEREGQRRLRSVRWEIPAQAEEPVEEYHFQSGGYVSETGGPYGVFSARYGARGPLEWDLAPVEAAGAGAPGHFSLQWDENGLLVRMRQEVAGAALIEYRYEYTLDERGNWLSRRETVYAERGGLFIPVGAKQTDRRIVYRTGE